MALVLADRVQETTATAGTGSVTLSGAVSGYQSFAVVGNGNTCYYTIVNTSAWEVGIGTYSTTGPTLARTTVLSNSNGNTSPITLSGSSNVFLTYPSEKSVNLDASGNVSALGTISSGVWQGTTIATAYGGTGVTTSSGANSNVLRDANQNITANNVLFGYNAITAAGGTTVLTVASAYYQRISGSTTQTIQLPDATTCALGQAWVFDNDSSGAVTIVDNASATVDVVPSGAYTYVFAESVSTSAGSWGKYALLPASYNFSTTAADFGGATISNAVYNGTAIGTAYGGTGLSGATPFTSGGALYANSASTLTSGTLPLTAGGTGQTTAQAAMNSFAGAVTSGSYLRGNGTNVVMSTIQAGDIPSLSATYVPVASTAYTSGFWMFNNMGNNHTTYTNADSIPGFGPYYLQGQTNSPGTGGASGQYYGFTLGLGIDYALSSYGCQIYWPRTSSGGSPYISVRFKESGTWGSWSKIYAGYADSAKYLTGAPAYTNGTDGWFRSSGQAGWYNADYSGGVYMTDTTWVKTYNNKGLWAGAFAGSSAYGNDTSQLQVQNAGGTGDSDVACITFHCSSQYGSKLHLRNDGYMGMGGWSASAWRWYTYLPNGDMTAAGNITAYSDPRLKTDIKRIDSALFKIRQLEGVYFKWIDSSVIGHPGEYDYGVLADQVARVMPELVTDSVHEAPEGDYYKTVAYDKFTPLLIEGVKEHDDIIIAQQKTIELQEERISKLEALVAKLV